VTRHGGPGPTQRCWPDSRGCCPPEPTRIIAPAGDAALAAGVVRRRWTDPYRRGRPGTSPEGCAGPRLAREDPSGARGSVLGVTAHLVGEWVVQQARSFIMQLGDDLGRLRYLLRDRDTRFTAAFDAVVVAGDRGCCARRCGRRGPMAMGSGGWQGSPGGAGPEVDLGMSGAGVGAGRGQRPGQRPPSIPGRGPGAFAGFVEAAGAVSAGRVVRRDRLGGLIHEYGGQAA
jgi:hypothetical protein